MTIRIFSDLHIEFEDLSIDTSGADAVVLAEDIHTKDRGLKWVTLRDDSAWMTHELLDPDGHTFWPRQDARLLPSAARGAVSSST